MQHSFILFGFLCFIMENHAETPKNKQPKSVDPETGNGWGLTPCPHINCLTFPRYCKNPVCSIERYRDNYCRGCCSCRRRPKKVNQSIKPCPHIICLAYVCPEGQRTKMTFSDYYGTRCRSCDKCIGHTCPQIKCGAPDCPEGYEPSPTLYKHRSITCQGCPVCKPAGPVNCPAIDCPATNQECPAGEEFVRSALVNEDGDTCLLCDACHPMCVATPCAAPDCDEYTVPDEVVNGRICPGCPVCPNPPAEGTDTD